MKRVALVGALALVTTVGCTRDARRADVDAQPGDLLIFAVTNPEGEIVEVQSSVAPNAAGLAFGEAHTLHSFVIGRADLVDASGELVDASTIRADRGERPGACGRCLAPPVVGPMVVHPGASCRVPSFAAAARFEAIDGRAIRREDLEATQAVRDAVFVTMDGDCPCTRVTPELSVPAEVCPILPSAAPIRAERVALFEDGAVVGVNKGFAFRVEPDGAVRTTSFRPATGNVQTIGLLSDGTTIVASTDRSLLTKSMIAATYGPNLERRELRDPPPVEPDQLVRLDGDETIYLLGERFSTLTEEPGVTACRVVDDRLDCTDQGVVFDAPRCPRITSGKLLGAFGLPGGGHVALANRGHVFYRPAGAREWYCDPESDDVFIDTSNGRRTIKDLLGFAVRGDVAMACVFDGVAGR